MNGVLITRNGKTLAVYGDPRQNSVHAEKVLFTHHRRDVAWAGRAMVEQGAEAIAFVRQGGGVEGIVDGDGDLSGDASHEFKLDLVDFVFG